MRNTGEMRNKYLWITVATLGAVVICWGLWVMLKPQMATGQPAGSLQNILLEHIEYLPEVYRAHENYAGQLQNDSCVLIFRYSSNMCVSCYQDDLMDLREFIKVMGRHTVLVLPAYPFGDRKSRTRMNSETNGLSCRNIPADSLALPVHETEGEMRYFAVADARGRIGMVFFPQAGRPGITQAYFREVKKRIKAQ
jgi:hypothetical protein